MPNDDDDDDEAPSSLIQVVVGNLTLSERELADAVRKERASAMGATVSGTSYSAADWTRIMVGYLVLLSVWLHESPLSVRDFLSESATLQAVIQPVAQSSGVDPLIQGLAAFLLGVAYEFDTDPGKAAVTRATMHPILQSRIGADQFAVRIARISEDVRFREVTPDVLESFIAVEEQAEADELRAKQIAEAKAAAAAALLQLLLLPKPLVLLPPGPKQLSQKTRRKPTKKLPTRISKSTVSVTCRNAVVRDFGSIGPLSSFGVRIRQSSPNRLLSIRRLPQRLSCLPAELLDAQRQAEALKDTVAKQAREIEVLEKRVEELTAAQAAAIEELQGKLTAAEEALSGHAPQLQAAQTELEQLKSTHAATLAEIQGKHDEVSRQLADVQAREEQSNGKVLQLTSEMARIQRVSHRKRSLQHFRRHMTNLRSRLRAALRVEGMWR